MKRITRKERMELKIREIRKGKSEERLRELLDIDKQIAENDGLISEDEFIESQRNKVDVK